MNRAELIGHLGADPVIRYTPEGAPKVSCSIATTEKWRDKGGAPKEVTDWHRLVFTGPVANVAADFLKKGSHVFVSGRLTSRKYQEDGVDKFITEILVRDLEMLGGGRGKPSHSARPAAGSAVPSTDRGPLPTPTGGIFDVDDRPF